MSKSKTIKILKVAIDAFALCVVFGIFMLIWNFQWFTVKWMATLIAVNMVLQQVIIELEKDDSDNQDNHPEKPNRFQEKLNQKIKEYGS